MAEDVPDDVNKKNIPSAPGDLGPTPTKVSATSRSPTKKTPGMKEINFASETVRYQLNKSWSNDTWDMHFCENTNHSFVQEVLKL